MINRLFRDYSELLFWCAALLALSFSNPSQSSHYTLCPLRLLGIHWCPGCGLGHSISFLLHGDIAGSWHAHWLGMPALLIIGWRIIDLCRQRLVNDYPLNAKKVPG